VPLLEENVLRLDDPEIYKEASKILSETLLDTIKKVYLTDKGRAKKNGGYTEFANMLKKLEAED
jgi:hypothetical protein